MKVKVINLQEDSAKLEMDNGLVLFCSKETALELNIGDEIAEEDIDFGEV